MSEIVVMTAGVSEARRWITMRALIRGPRLSKTRDLLVARDVLANSDHPNTAPYVVEIDKELSRRAADVEGTA